MRPKHGYVSQQQVVQLIIIIRRSLFRWTSYCYPECPSVLSGSKQLVTQELSNDDDDGNEDSKKAIDLFTDTTAVLN